MEKEEKKKEKTRTERQDRERAKSRISYCQPLSYSLAGTMSLAYLYLSIIISTRKIAKTIIIFLPQNRMKFAIMVFALLAFANLSSTFSMKPPND